jgi:O-antigen/teichoic acid export membrane protein
MPIALVLTVAVVLGAPGAIMGVGLSARGRPELRSACLVVACAVDVVLILVLVPEHGAMGAAVATLVGNATTGFLAAAFQWRVFHLQPWSFYGVRRSDLVVLRRTARESVARLRSAG